MNPEDLDTDAANELLDRLKDEVREAKELLEFSLSQRAAIDPAAPAVPDCLVDAIKSAESFLLKSSVPSDEDRADFEQAYRDLAQLAAPVSVRTLHATSNRFGRTHWLLARGRKASDAIIWSRKLWMITSIFLVATFASQTLDDVIAGFFPPDEEVVGGWSYWLEILSQVLVSLAPFIHGGLGACAYLLRSCHQYHYSRQFNTDRIPEYYSRILLGVVGGGVVQLFVSEVSRQDGSIEALSASALGFLAGYNTGFLFATLERVAEALLPRVGIETVMRAPRTRARPALDNVSLESLYELLRNARSDEEKRLLQETIDRLNKRL